MSTERRLAAILAADVAGYSRLIGVDEEGTLARLKALRHELINPAIAQGRGRVVKTMGDGILIEFPSVVEAVRCAIEVQQGMVQRNRGLAPEQRIEFRVGIHLGDVVADGGDLLGDGVNIAARLEGIAETGGICLSNAAYEQVRDKISEEFVDLGEKELKNIARPVRVYLIEPKAPSATTTPDAAKAPLALPEKPSIAVLPFLNMSGDPEQEYFADGMVEDIITGLSRVKWLFVIARNSSFAYRGKSPDVRQVGRELGVRYILEGSVRKAAGRVRITGQLIDAISGVHIWADRFEGALEDVFALQDQVTSSVVGAIEPALTSAEMQRSHTKPTSSLDAYDCYLRALAQRYLITQLGLQEAVAYCRKAIKIDPRYAAAYGLAANTLFLAITQSWSSDVEADRKEGITYAQKAIELGSNDPIALGWGGSALVLLARDYDRGLSALERSLSLNPNSAQAWAMCGWTHFNIGEGETAIQDFQRALRLSPHDPMSYGWRSGIGWGHFVQGRYEEAVKWSDMSLNEQPMWLTALRCKVAACGLLEQTDEAQKALRTLLMRQPDATIPKLRAIMPLKRPEHMAAYLEGLLKAGLPE